MGILAPNSNKGATWDKRYAKAEVHQRPLQPLDQGAVEEHKCLEDAHVQAALAKPFQIIVVVENRDAPCLSVFLGRGRTGKQIMN